MDINQKQSLFSLWLASFGLVNRTMGTLLKACVILWVIPVVVMGGLGYFLMTRAPMVLVVLGIGFALYIFITLMASSIILYRILNSEVEKNHESLTEAVCNSLVPAFYMIVYSLGMGILGTVISYVGNFTGSKLVVGILNLAFFFCITVRVIFAPKAIAVREMGPVEAVVHSWHLTSGDGYWRTLGMCLWSFLLPVLTILCAGVLLYAAYVCIPLYFPSFDLTNLTWHTYVTLALVGILWLFVSLCMVAFPFLVFLNMDSLFDQAQWDSKPLIKPLPAPGAFHPAPAQQAKWETTDPQPKEDDNGVEDITIQRSSVQNDNHTNTFSEHLKEVYDPAHTDVIEYTEEDRMPTIMFDDHMAQQLEENRKMWNKKADTSSGKLPDDPPEETIKMSK